MDVRLFLPKMKCNMSHNLTELEDILVCVFLFVCPHYDNNCTTGAVLNVLFAVKQSPSHTDCMWEIK